MRVVILGARGQLAGDLCRAFGGDEVVPLSRQEFDICDEQNSLARLQAHRPDIVVNTAAYNFVDKAEQEPAGALRVNAIGPLNLARACSALGAMLVHFSTDYVFGAAAEIREPWSEDDAPAPQSAYAISKLAGEHFVRSYAPRHLVIRTCGLYGHRGTGGKGGNFVETMLKLAKTKPMLRIVNDQRCTPTATTSLAKTTVEMIRRELTGLYHVTDAGSCTWFEFAREIFRIARINVQTVPITSAEFGAAARRPTWSVLSNEKRLRQGIAPSPAWQVSLSAYLSIAASNGGA